MITKMFVAASLLLIPAPLVAEITPVPEADAAYARHDFSNAAKLWDEACRGGNATGCYELAVAYRDGEGVKASPERARQLFDTACTGHDGRGCFNLSFAYAEGDGVQQSDQRSSSYLQQGCDANFMPACANLAYNYLNGRGVAKNVDIAVTLLNKACDNGAGPACFTLSALYDKHEQGMIREDPALANTALEKGCDLGDNNSCTNLGYHYGEGYGVPRNLDRTASLYSAVCDNATSMDCSMFASWRFAGTGTNYAGGNVTARFMHVAGVYQAACDDKFAQGCLSLASLLWRTGNNCKQHHDQIVEMTKRALALKPSYPLALKFMARLNNGDCPEHPL